MPSVMKVFADFSTSFGLNPTHGWHGDSASGFNPPTGAGSNCGPLGFTGHPKDCETGLTYMQARHYDPVMGRFLGIDPVGFLETGEPALFNRYTYCYNDPVYCTDPDGEFGVVGAALGAVVGGGVGAIIGGGAEAFGQIRSGKSLGELNFGAIGAKALTSGVSGAITGAVAGSGAGFVAVAVTGGTYGALVGAADTAIDAAVSGEGIQAGELAENVAIGAVTGALSLGRAPGVSNAVGKEVVETAIDGAIDSAIGTGVDEAQEHYEEPDPMNQENF